MTGSSHLRVHDALQPGRPVGAGSTSGDRGCRPHGCGPARASNCIAKFGLTPDSLMDLWIRTLAKHGIDSFWIYDCLYNMERDGAALPSRPRRRAARSRAAIMYGISPVHTDEWFAARVQEFVRMGDHRRDLLRGRCWHPEAGTRQDADAGARRSGRRRADRDAVPQHDWRGADTTISSGRGRRPVLHTAPGPMANGPSVPSTEQTCENLRWSGYTTTVDLDRVRRISEPHAPRGRAGRASDRRSRTSTPCSRTTTSSLAG